MNFIRHLKKSIGAIVLIAASQAHAGSYEDFFIAIQNDNAGNLKSLLQRGFDPNSRDPKGQTGLIVAMKSQSPKVTKALLDTPGVDIDAVNTAGESALMIAALKGDLPAAQLLLDKGAKVNQAGWSPILYAATGPEPKMVQLLLDKGADLNAGSPNLSTPLMMAAQYGAEDSVDLLLKRGADPKRRNQRELRASDFAKLAGRDALAARLLALER